ncbi:MAG: hypothetical protein JST19_05845 [Bacteroidetes bacterium]|nr:hypothetical protein [Bacteroidota bacterium]
MKKLMAVLILSAFSLGAFASVAHPKMQQDTTKKEKRMKKDTTKKPPQKK